ncbi:hypothetical protein PV08_00065 [Exophiala spinifera]|uniref:BHLH domain-containing protein n=1 Tax=Exophiala spinifera TaxID=91928 RepID=A0A0D2BKN4_9EURO|nr:uncharacterized protein PV08_00065 [Exophiala spinifera]KIW19493.1 hypothetical protein PV08_00065 [Exophiala spinifera]
MAAHRDQATAAYQDPILNNNQQRSYGDDVFFFQPDINNHNHNHSNSNNDNTYPDMTYFDAWPAQGHQGQNYQYNNCNYDYDYWTKSPFVNTTYSDSFENAAVAAGPVSFIVPSQTQIFATSSLPSPSSPSQQQQQRYSTDTEMTFEQEQGHEHGQGQHPRQSLKRIAPGGRRRSGPKPRSAVRPTASSSSSSSATFPGVGTREGSSGPAQDVPAIPTSQGGGLGPPGTRSRTRNANVMLTEQQEQQQQKQDKSPLVLSSAENRSENKKRSQSDSSKEDRDEDEDEDENEEEDMASLKAKYNHSIIERRYRDNLNGKINQLHRTLQATEASSPLFMREQQQQQRFDFDGASALALLPPAPTSEHLGRKRVRKCDIMTRALEYVHRSETESRHMRDEIQRLQDQVRGLERLIKCEDCTLLQNVRRMVLEKPC